MTQNHRHKLKSVVAFEFDGMAAMAQRAGCALPSAVPRPSVETARSNYHSYRDVIQGASKGNEDISDEDEPFAVRLERQTQQKGQKGTGLVFNSPFLSDAFREMGIAHGSSD
jgi:hypothetical protein